MKDTEHVMSIDTLRTPAKHKFRDSCDGCAAAKVKCSKVKPVCSRCEDRNLSCYYSISNRLGRRPAARTRSTSPREGDVSSAAAAAAATTTTTAQFDFSAPPSVSGTTTPGTSSSTLGDAFINPRSLSNTDLPSLSDPIWMNSPDILLNETMNIDFFSPAMNFNPPATYDLTQESDQWLNYTGQDLDYLQTSSLMTPAPSICAPAHRNGSLAPETSPHSHIPSFRATLNTPVQDLFGPEDANHTPNNNSLEASTCTSGADCLSTATELLVLQHGIGMTANRTQSHDIIINTNRTSVDMSMTILKCSCLKSNNHIKVLLALIAFRVISCYLAVAQQQDESESDDQDNTSGDTFPRSPPSFSPLSPRMFSRQKRAQIVLGELHRVVRLVHLLSEDPSDEVRVKRERGDSVGGDVTMGGVGDLNSALSSSSAAEISGAVLEPLLDSLKERSRVVTKMIMAIIRDS